MSRFPGAPDGSYISEEGWLVVGDEAWTEDEWRVRSSTDPDKYTRRYDTDEERMQARRLAKRTYNRRRRKGLMRDRDAA